MAKIDELCGKIAAPPVLDPRTPDEILGYDEFWFAVIANGYIH